MSFKLKPIQLKAAKLLAKGESITITAKEIGSVRQTVHRWLKDDVEFIAYLNSLKIEQLESTRAQIQAASCSAIKTLIDVMNHSKSDQARINAACKVLEMTGFTKDSMEMYGWGVGEDTPVQVKVKKEIDKMLEDPLCLNL